MFDGSVTHLDRGLSQNDDGSALQLEEFKSLAFYLNLISMHFGAVILLCLALSLLCKSKLTQRFNATRRRVYYLSLAMCFIKTSSSVVILYLSRHQFDSSEEKACAIFGAMPGCLFLLGFFFYYLILIERVVSISASTAIMNRGFFLVAKAITFLTPVEAVLTLFVAQGKVVLSGSCVQGALPSWLTLFFFCFDTIVSTTFLYLFYDPIRQQELKIRAKRGYQTGFEGMHKLSKRIFYVSSAQIIITGLSLASIQIMVPQEISATNENLRSHYIPWLLVPIDVVFNTGATLYIVGATWWPNVVLPGTSVHSATRSSAFQSSKTASRAHKKYQTLSMERVGDVKR